MKKKRLLSTAIAGTLAAAIIVGGGTFAYLTAQTNTVTNQFKATQLSVSLKEGELDATTEAKTNDSYKIIPGTSQVKDPKISVTTDVPVYVFVKVTDTVNTDAAVVDYTIDSSWGVPIVTEDNYKVYAQEVSATTTAGISVLKNDTVSYAKTLTNAQVEAADKGTLVFQAYAIQKNNGGTDFADALAAWNALTAE